MYVCEECNYESEKQGKHCGKQMVERKEEELEGEEVEEEESWGEEE